MTKKTSRKTDTATEGASREEIPSFEPLEGDIGKQTFRRHAFGTVSVEFDDGEAKRILVPVPDGLLSDEAVKGAAAFARYVRRVEHAWTGFSDEQIKRDTTAIATAAGSLIVLNVLRVAERVHGEEELEGKLGEVFPDLDRAADEASQKLVEAFLSNAEEAASVASDIQRQAVATLLQEEIDESILDEEEFDRAFLAAFAKHYARHWEETAFLVVQDLARQALDAIEPAKLSLDDVVAFLKPTKPTVELVDGVEMIRALPAAGGSFVVDHAAGQIVKWLGGKAGGKKLDKDGFDVLVDEKEPFRARTYDVTRLGIRPAPDRILEEFRSRAEPNETHVIEPKSVQPILDKLYQERNETKAKTFVATLMHAHEAQNRARFAIPFDVLVHAVTGYDRVGPAKTKSALYWRKAVEIWRYLQYDLQHLQVNVRIVREENGVPDKHEFMGEYLMEKPRLRARQEFAYKDIHDEITTALQTGNEANLVAYMKSIGVTAVELGFPPNIVAAFGIGKQRELANPDGMKLKGAAFWLWCDIPFRRRWHDTKRKTPAGSGTPLLEVLKRYGFVDEALSRMGKKKGRASYKEALSRFLAAVETMIELGELDPPGVKIYRHHGGPGRAKDAREDLERQTKQRGVYLTESSLDGYFVDLVHRAERIAELGEARAKKRKPRRKRPKASESPREDGGGTA